MYSNLIIEQWSTTSFFTVKLLVKIKLSTGLLSNWTKCRNNLPKVSTKNTRLLTAGVLKK